MKLDFEIKEEDMIELMKLNRIDYGEDAFWPVFNKKKQGQQKTQRNMEADTLLTSLKECQDLQRK